ncbi:hypothetical protein [Massilia niastensis]|uniref:hypothetical protein n=1 Tax=Massilia niastensis TaxID=544911 RepID=UPI0003666BA6|nr:hypothetical protein [Massilia niastensis]
MHTEHTERHHSPIHTATVDNTDPRAPRRNMAKDVLSSSRRLRHRIGLIAGLCVGLVAVVIAFE